MMEAYLVVRGAESSSDIFIIKYHHFECKIFSQLIQRKQIGRDDGDDDNIKSTHGNVI